MAITKILPRNTRLDLAIEYVLNGDKTDAHILTAHLNCDPGREYQQMMETKQEVKKTGGRQAGGRGHACDGDRPGQPDF